MVKRIARLAGAVVLGASVAVVSPAGTTAQQEEGGEQKCQLEGSQLLNQAEDLINEAAMMDTTDATAAATRAQYEQAWKRAQLALQQDTADAAAYYMAGRASVGIGEYARADSLLDRFVKMKPACSSVAENIRFDGWADSFNAGIRAYQADDDSAALAKFEQANRLLRDPRSLNNAALIHQQRGDLERAEELYREALKVAEGSKEFRKQYRTATINLAELLRNKGDRDQMLTLYRRYLGERPDDATALINYAVGLREANREDSAQKVLEGVLNREDLTFRERLNVGRSLMGMKSYEAARIALEQARRDRPYNKTVMEQLMTAAANSGQLDRAASLGDTLVAWYPYQKSLYQSYVQVLDRQGRADRVQQVLPDMQNMEVRIPQVRIARKGEDAYLVRGQVRGAAVRNQTVKLPVELIGEDGEVVARTGAEVQVPGGDQLASFQVQIETDQPVAGFRYGRIQKGS